MGRRKKLTALEILDGRPSHKPLRNIGLVVQGEPFVAEHLMEDARGCIEVIKQSMPEGIYSALDSFLLAAFAVAWSVHKEAALQVSKPDFEFVYTDEDGNQRRSPWLMILDKQAILLASLGDRLGLDPKSRNAMTLSGAKQQVSKFDGLIGQTRSSVSLDASQYRRE